MVLKSPLRFLQRLSRYCKTRAEWYLQGKPVRPRYEILRIYEICRKCEHFEQFTESEGECGICGCNIKQDHLDLNFNKLTWGNTKCPLETPKWDIFK